MARLPYVDPETAPEPARSVLLDIAGQRGRAFNVYRMLAHSPGTLERVYRLARYLWLESELPAPLQELVILRVAQLTGSDYEWARHRSLAARAGVSERKVQALAGWQAMPAVFEEHERAALAVTDEATLHVEATQESFDALRRVAGNRGLVELLVLVGFYGMMARLLRTLAVDPEPGDEPLPKASDAAGR